MFSTSFERSIHVLVNSGLHRSIGGRKYDKLLSMSLRQRTSASVEYNDCQRFDSKDKRATQTTLNQAGNLQTRSIRFSACPRVSAEESTLLKPQNFDHVEFSLKNKDTETSKEQLKDPPVKTLYDLDGPRGWPVVGNFFMYLRKENKGKMHQVQAKLHQIYGRMFREKWGPNWQCHVSDPRLIEEIYRHEGRFPNRPCLNSWLLHRQMADLPHGLTTAQGSEWQLYRTEFGKRLFCPSAVRSLISPLNEVADDFVRRLHELSREGDGAVLASKLPNICYLWSLEAAGSFLFETRLGCLSGSIPQRTQSFIDSLLEMMSSSLYLIVGEKLHQLLNTKFWQQHKNAWDNIFKIGKELIDKKIKDIKSGEASTGPYLSYLLANQNVTTDQIYSNITELLMAGSDTTANTMCFVLYLLANNPEKQEILRKEINQVFSKDNPGADKTYVSSSHVDSLKYLKCVIKETMRMYPVVTMNCRILNENIKLRGFDIPKNTLFVMNHYAASMDPELFSDPEKFLPERWARGERRTGETPPRAHPFGSLPFGFGGRSCLGKHVSNQELMVTITKILMNFEILPIPGESLKPVLRTLLTPGERVPIKLKRF